MAICNISLYKYYLNVKFRTEYFIIIFLLKWYKINDN